MDFSHGRLMDQQLEGFACPASECGASVMHMLIIIVEGLIRLIICITSHKVKRIINVNKGKSVMAQGHQLTILASNILMNLMPPLL